MSKQSEDVGLMASAARAFRSALVVACFLVLALALYGENERQQLQSAATQTALVTVAPPQHNAPAQIAPDPALQVEKNGEHPLLIIPPRSHSFDRSDEAPTRRPDVWPVATKRVDPECTATAIKARIDGVVRLAVVVAADGSVIRGRVLTPLPFGMSDRAIEAVRHWRFRPGTVDGKPVATVMTLTLDVHCNPSKQRQP